MALNPNIALGVRGVEVANPLAQYAQISQLQSAQNQNALAQYQLATAQREQESTNALNEAYRSAYNPQTGEIDVNTLRKTLSTGGFGSKLPGLEKMLGELQTQKLQAQKLQGEVTAQPIALQIQQANLADAKLKQSRAFLDTINPADPNAPAMYLKWHQANHSDPVIGPMLAARGVTADQSRAQIDAAIAQGPQAFAQLLNQSKLGTEKFMELNKPTTQVVDQSGQRQVLQIPGLGGAPTTVGTYADVPLPANVQAQKIQIAQQSRPPLQPVAPTITTIEDPTKPGSFLQVDARTYQGGGAGSPGVIGGARPSATTEKTAAQRVQMGKDLGFAITQLSDITKDGGLIDQSTGSGAGKLVDIGAGFIGKATPGAIAIGKIAPIADLVLKMVPRFEGPQSNADTKSYKEAAGQLADASLPTAIRKEAGKTVLRIMTERKNQFSTREMAAEGAEAAQVAPPAGFVPDQR